MIKRILGVAGMVLAGMLAAGQFGCSLPALTQPTPRLSADAFVRDRPDAGQGVDRGGFVAVDGHRRPVRPVSEDPVISDTVREVVKSPVPEDIGPAPESNPPGTQPANTAAITADAEATTQATQPAQRPGVAVGQFQWVGCVVARVDGEPIYADKVLTTLDHSLAAEARAGDERRFRAVAKDLVVKQITEFIDNELEYAAAKKALEKKDQNIAKLLTAEWRKEQIRKAGGSEAEAKKRAAAEGFDFEELARQQYRINMTRLYYQSKIFPLIQIRAEDMRQFYQVNIKKFQKPAAVKFRVLWVSADKAGGRNEALKKADDIYERASKGENFSELAYRLSDDPSLSRTKGVVGNETGWMKKGEFIVEKVEDAVWALHPGEVSHPIDAKNRGMDGFWIAKLDQIDPGSSEPFENPKVQSAIRSVLHSQQLNKLREAHQQMLQRQAVVLQTEGAVDVTMQMVMQRYPVWVASR
jgi:hypothetical protein